MRLICTGPKPFSKAIDALRDADFKELMGWTLFERDYFPENGEPVTALIRAIQNAVIYPREAQGGYLEGKPIGEYLRAAVALLESVPTEDENEGWLRQEYEEDQKRETLREQFEEDGD